MLEVVRNGKIAFFAHLLNLSPNKSPFNQYLTENSEKNEAGPIYLTMTWNILIKFGTHINVDVLVRALPNDVSLVEALPGSQLRKSPIY